MPNDEPVTTSEAPRGWSEASRPRRRARLAMPEEVRAVLELEELRGAYDARPPYQRNDYIGWIERAVRPSTRIRRIAQMLDELRAGQGYMGMVWSPMRARRRRSE